ncbi:Amino acid/polyamine transporter [Phytophthora cinnamomi]|uniref:Amino acid/polyamine transporter n=1 Tax=Phytophthora cinnamomi TaxID=4785 RepID=UPI00355AA679|nr:Amino acid/polyamine transporter [Phytophthora cinnamomi]
MGKLLYAIACTTDTCRQMLTKLHPTRGTTHVALITGSIIALVLVIVLRTLLSATFLVMINPAIRLIGAIVSYLFQLAAFIIFASRHLELRVLASVLVAIGYFALGAVCFVYRVKPRLISNGPVSAKEFRENLMSSRISTRCAVINGSFFGWQAALVIGFDGLLTLAVVTVQYVLLSFSIALSCRLPCRMVEVHTCLLCGIGKTAAFSLVSPSV